MAVTEKRGEETLPDRIRIGIRGLEGSGVDEAGIVVDVEKWRRDIASALGAPPEGVWMSEAIKILEAVPGLKVEREEHDRCSDGSLDS